MISFNDLDLTKQYSYADYLAFRFKERLELIKGFIFKMPSAPSKATSRNIVEYVSFFFTIL